MTGWRKRINKPSQYKIETIQATCWVLCKSFYADQADYFKKVNSHYHTNLIKEIKTQISSNALWLSPTGDSPGKGAWKTVEQISAKQSDFTLEFAKDVWLYHCVS